MNDVSVAEIAPPIPHPKGSTLARETQPPAPIAELRNVTPTAHGLLDALSQEKAEPEHDFVTLPRFPGEASEERVVDLGKWKIPKKYEGKPAEWRQHIDWLKTNDLYARLALELESFDQERLAHLEEQRERYTKTALAQLTEKQKADQQYVDQVTAQARREATEIAVLSGLSESVFHRYDYYGETAQRYSDPVLNQALAYRDKIKETILHGLDPDTGQENGSLTYNEALVAISDRAKIHSQEGTVFSEMERRNLDQLASSDKIPPRLKEKFLRTPGYVTRAEYNAAQAANNQDTRDTSTSRTDVLGGKKPETKTQNLAERIFRFLTDPTIQVKTLDEFQRLYGPLTPEQFVMFHAMSPSTATDEIAA